MSLGAFRDPRDGATEILDDDRVTVWDYAWASGTQGLRYRPARETVIVGLVAGKLRVTGCDGTACVSDVEAGTARHMTGGSGETVEVVSGSPRAILFQLKEREEQAFVEWLRRDVALFNSAQ